MQRILIVEDDDDSRDLLTQTLQESYDVFTARDGQQALEQARDVRPHLILMDLSLPVMDGWEATRHLKADPDLRHIPVVALTAHAMSDDELRARDAGCNDYLTKPISPGRILDRIAGWLSGESFGDRSQETP